MFKRLASLIGTTLSAELKSNAPLHPGKLAQGDWTPDSILRSCYSLWAVVAGAVTAYWIPETIVALILVAVYLRFDLQGGLPRAKSRGGLMGFVRRIYRRLAFVLFFFFDYLLGGAQKLLLSRIGNGVTAAVVAGYLIAERLWSPTTGFFADLFGFLAGIIFYVHMYKLAMDWVEHRLGARDAGLNGSLTLGLARLLDFLTQGTTLAPEVRAGGLADKQEILIKPYARREKELAIAIFRVERNPTLNEMRHELIATNEHGRQLRERFAWMSAELDRRSAIRLNASTKPKGNPDVNPFTLCMIEDRSVWESDTPRSSCVVIQDLPAEKYLGRLGTPFDKLESGSCVGFTYARAEGDLGYLVLVVARHKRKFRKRDADRYQRSLQATATALLAFDVCSSQIGAGPVRAIVELGPQQPDPTLTESAMQAGATHARAMPLTRGRLRRGILRIWELRLLQRIEFRFAENSV